MFLHRPHAIAARGIGKPDTIAIMSRNSPEYAVAHFGCAQTGAILVNLMRTDTVSPSLLLFLLLRFPAPGFEKPILGQGGDVEGQPAPLLQFLELPLLSLAEAPFDHRGNHQHTHSSGSGGSRARDCTEEHAS